MAIQKVAFAGLLVGVVIGILAAPLASQSQGTPLGPSFERFESHLEQWKSDRELEVQLRFKDGGYEWGHMCATPAPTSEFLGESQKAMSAVSAVTQGSGTEFLSVQIPLVFNVLQTSDGKGYLTDEQIAEQVRVLNQKFRKYGAEFYVRAVYDVVKKSWFKKCLPFKKNGNLNRKYLKFTKRLAVDPVSTINIYTCQPHSNYLGFGVIAGWLPEDDWANAILLHHLTLPGGPSVNYSQGITGVHEMGHYLGLFHTFHPGIDGEPIGCEGNGDEVRDTAYEAEPAYVCEPRDSCPQAGTDPITNFMDYTDDICRKKFTRGQRNRMTDMTLFYRPGLLGVQ